MAGGGQWEVVGAKSKKSKNKNTAKIVAKEKNKEKPNEFYGLVSEALESKTFYDAFLEETKEQNQTQPKKAPIEASKPNGKLSQKKKKTDKKMDKVPPKLGLEDAVASVSEEDIKNHLATLEVLCPKAPLLWLKDLTQYLNVKLDVPIIDGTFSGKPSDYPSGLLNKKAYKLISKVIHHGTPQVLEVFYEVCLQTAVSDSIKGLNTLGHRIMLQCVGSEFPSVVLSNLTKCFELCKSHQNRQNICLLLLWAAGQAGNNNIEAGFRVWVDLMFPVIGFKNCTTYSVEYLEKLLGREDVQRCNRSLLNVKDFIPIIDYIHSNDTSKTIQKRLLAIYPVLKELSYGPQPEAVLRNYFPSYLIRLGPQCSQSLNDEVLNSLMYCLEKDIQCYSTWRQLYTQHFVQSKLLIAHINKQWESLPSQFPKRCLKETLSGFQVTNEELLSGGKVGLQDVEDCMMVNKELLSKLHFGSFSWLRLFFLSLLIISLLLMYDIFLHGSFKESSTGLFMKDYGLLHICTQAAEKIMYFQKNVQRLLNTYLPVASAWMQNSFLPFLELCVQNLVHALCYLWNCTLRVRVLCNEIVPPLLSSAGTYFEIYFETARRVSKEVGMLFPEGFKKVSSLANSFFLWIKATPALMESMEMIQVYIGNISHLVFVNLQSTAIYIFEVMQNYLPFLNDK